jgi:hypothetical protein
MTNFKDLIDAVHDLKTTSLLDGETFIAQNETIRITPQQFEEISEDPYLLQLPPEAAVDLANNKILGITVVVG